MDNHGAVRSGQANRCSGNPLAHVLHPFYLSKMDKAAALEERAVNLTRRPDNDPHHQGGWFIYFGDVRVGHIGRRAGVPTSAPQWGWSCGFYPGCDPGQQTNGTGDTFEDARAGFEQAWKKLAASRTEAHYALWRQNQDFHAWKDRMHDEQLPLPTQRTSGIARCFCGAEITNGSVSRHIQDTHRGIGVDSHSGRQ